MCSSETHGTLSWCAEDLRELRLGDEPALDEQRAEAPSIGLLDSEHLFERLLA